MKKDYTKVWGWFATHPGDFYYKHVSGGYGRSLRTFQEQRRNTCDLADRDLADLGVKVRRSRAGNHLNPWNLERCATRYGAKTWKDFTRHKKQWGVARDPKPEWGSWVAMTYHDDSNEAPPWSR